MVLSYANHVNKIHIYASKLCAAISDDFRNSPKMAAHDLDAYIFIFTKIGMLSPHFSAIWPAFLKLFFQRGSFGIGLIRVIASPEFTTVTSTMSRLNFCTYLNHCAIMDGCFHHYASANFAPLSAPSSTFSAPALEII